VRALSGTPPGVGRAVIPPHDPVPGSRTLGTINKRLINKRLKQNGYFARFPELRVSIVWCPGTS